MKNAVNVSHGLVSMLAEVLAAGLILRRDTLTDVGNLNLRKKREKFVVYTDGATKVWEFESVHDAWCSITERVHECPECKGDGHILLMPIRIIPMDRDLQAVDGMVGEVCPVCGEFGKITEEQFNEYRMRR